MMAKLCEAREGWADAPKMRSEATIRREGAEGAAKPTARYNAEPVTSFKVEKDLAL